MVKSLRLAISCLFFFTLQTALLSQNFSGEPVLKTVPQLEPVFLKWDIYRIDAKAMADYLKAKGQQGDIQLELGAQRFQLSLQDNEIRPQNALMQLQTPQGLQTAANTGDVCFKGHESGGGMVRLSIAEGLVYGYIRVGDLRYYIEPLRYYDDAAAADEFILYERRDVVPNENVTCALIETQEEFQDILHDAEKSEGAEAQACYQLDLAVAADRQMFDKYGSVSGVQNHIDGILNMVEGDYTGNFNHDIDFNIVTYFIVTGTNPWTSSNDAGALLDSFRSWGQSGGFGVSFDLGELWTDRDFTGSTVGIAYLNAVCTSIKYHCLQDFTSNSELLRCMTSHEIGHNFNCQHDPQGGGSCPPNYIMCPFVSTSNTWSTTSINTVNSKITALINNGCLSPCSSAVTADFDWAPFQPCEDTPVQFTNQSTGIITNYNWTFQGGTPGTSTQANPVVTFANPGTFNVTLTVSGPGGATNTKVQQITIRPKPVANFIYDVSGLTVNFTSTSTNADTHSWDFGDGFFSLDQNPEHTYDVGGMYTVVLTVINDCGSSTKSILINTAPSANFSAIQTIGCPVFVVQYVNESSNNATNYLWSFPGGSPGSSTAENPVVSYNAPGNYSATLTAFNNAGSTQLTRTNYITVLANPQSNFSQSVNGLTVTFTNNSNNATSYLWNFGDGNTSTETNPTHTYAQGGVYTVVLIATNQCGNIANSQQVVLLSPPTAVFTASPATGCAALTVQFTYSGTGATSYSWTFPGGTPSSSTDANPVVTYNTSGTFTATLTATNAAGSASSNQTITVTPAPNAAFSSLVDLDTVSFTNGSTNATGYAWDFGDGNSSSQASPEHIYQNDGTYTVRLISSGPCGVDTAFQTVNIVTPVGANFSVSNANGCAPLTVQYNNNSSANATTFAWTFPGGTPASSSLANPSVVYNTTGTYGATLIASNSQFSDTITLNNIVVVPSGPAAGFSSSINSLSVTFNNSSSNSTAYNWDFGDGNSSSQANPVHTYSTDGVYTVTLTAVNACGTATATSVVTVVSGPTASFTASPTSGCGPLSVQFTNTSSFNASTFSWQFPGGTPSGSNEQNPVVVYTTPGVYNVSLTVSNAAGSNTAIQNALITVLNQPGAAFSATVNGASASFNNGSSNATSYSWNFGDNTSSTETNPSHTYLNDGMYTVTLTATNNCGSNTSTQTVTIVTPPTAGFTASNTTGCGPLTVQYTNTSSINAVNFNWQFPGGVPASSSEANPVVVYSVPGTYSATLVASNAAGSNVLTQNNIVTVLPTPTAGFSENVNLATVVFTNASQQATTYTWDFGDGNTSNLGDPVHVYANDGVYTVTLTASNNCGSSSSTQTITIVTPPTAAFSSSVSEGCAPLTVQFNNQSSDNAVDYLWTFEGGIPASSSEANPLVIWDMPGAYTVTLLVSNAAGQSTSSSSIVVNTTPTADFFGQTAGMSVVLTNNSVNALSYTWDFGDGNTSTETNPTHTYLLQGTYTVSLIATNLCGSETYQSSVEISGAPPIAQFSASETTGCAPFTVQFQDQSAGMPSAWVWGFQGGTPPNSTEQNPTVVYSQPGTYGVSLEVINPFGNNNLVLNQYITVGVPPTAGFTPSTPQQGQVTFTNTSVGGTSFMWTFGDGNTSTEQNPIHTYDTSGVFTVALTAANICGANTVQSTVNIVLVGTETPDWLTQLFVYPNPNNGQFTIDMAGEPARMAEFSLHNALGQLIRRDIADFSTGRLMQTLNYPELASGIYVLQIRAGEKTTAVKITVQ